MQDWYDQTTEMMKRWDIDNARAAIILHWHNERYRRGGYTNEERGLISHYVSDLLDTMRYQGVYSIEWPTQFHRLLKRDYHRRGL